MSNQSGIPQSIFQQAFFLDTGAFKAIYDERDQYHKKAILFRDQLKTFAYPLYTSNLTIAETYRLLLHEPRLGTIVSLNFLDDIYGASFNIIRPKLTDDMVAKNMLHKYKYQVNDLTYTDAINMSVMMRIGLKNVFAFDWHFGLLGFQILP